MKTSYLFFIWPVFLTLALTVYSCRYDKQENIECTESTPAWNGAVKQIMTANCALSGCHLGSPAGGFPLDSYEAAKSYGAGIVSAVKHESDYPMPKGRARLKDCEIDILQKWVDLKCPLNPGDVMEEVSLCEDTNAIYNGVVAQILNTNCASGGCHSGDPAGSEYVFDTYEGAKLNLANAMPNIRHSGGYSPMPKYGDKLDACVIEILEKWIDNGYPLN